MCLVGSRNLCRGLRAAWEKETLAPVGFQGARAMRVIPSDHCDFFSDFTGISSVVCFHSKLYLQSVK